MLAKSEQSESRTEPSADDLELEIACTLTSEDFRQRQNAIGDVARQSLRSWRRAPGQLHLAYDASATERVRELIALERRCCTFLEFDTKHAGDLFEVTITSPEQAIDAVEAIFVARTQARR